MTATMVFAQGDRGEKGDRGEQVSWDMVPSIPSCVVPLSVGLADALWRPGAAIPGRLCSLLPFDTQCVPLPFSGKGWLAWTPRAPRAQGR